jgi:uncharacterized membrane protein
MQSRFKSWATWLSVASLITFVSKTYFMYEIPEADQLVNLVLVALTGFGVLNNPTDKENF